MPSEAVIQAAISTSSTWPLRDEVGKAKYRARVERLLEAVEPVFRSEFEAEALVQEQGEGHPA